MTSALIRFRDRIQRRLDLTYTRCDLLGTFTEDQKWKVAQVRRIITAFMDYTEQITFLLFRKMAQERNLSADSYCGLPAMS